MPPHSLTVAPCCASSEISELGQIGLAAGLPAADTAHMHNATHAETARKPFPIVFIVLFFYYILRVSGKSRWHQTP